jgi:hypothetical protein
MMNTQSSNNSKLRSIGSKTYMQKQKSLLVSESDNSSSSEKEFNSDSEKNINSNNNYNDEIENDDNKHNNYMHKQ